MHPNWDHVVELLKYEGCKCGEVCASTPDEQAVSALVLTEEKCEFLKEKYGPCEPRCYFNEHYNKTRAIPSCMIEGVEVFFSPRRRDNIPGHVETSTEIILEVRTTPPEDSCYYSTGWYAIHEFKDSLTDTEAVVLGEEWLRHAFDPKDAEEDSPPVPVKAEYRIRRLTVTDEILTHQSRKTVDDPFL